MMKFLVAALVSAMLMPAWSASIPYALVRNTTPDAPSRIDLVLFDPLTKQIKSRKATSLNCERVHLGGKTVFCLGVPKKPGQAGPADFLVTDAALKPLFGGEMPAGVVISRARVSADGKYAAATIFLTDHSYGADVFSTQVNIIDIGQRKLTLPPLEYWTTMQNGTQVHARDLNFWGVTFNPKNSDEFYLTAAIGAKPYLAKGSIAKRRIDLIRPDVECPSFSPDGSRLAFKYKTGRASWLPAVLDLTTQNVAVFKKSESVDDQIEWLDDHTLVYELTTRSAFAVKTDLMQLDMRSAGNTPKLWLRDAGSPAIARD
jgi:hypothetical protein